MIARVSAKNDVDFQVLFEAVPALFLVIKPDTDYTILAASDAYLDAMGRKREETIGRPLFKVFLPNRDDPAASANKLIDKSIKTILKNKVSDIMPLVKYDVPIPGSKGALEEHYWAASNSPVLNKKNEVICIIHRTENVTETFLAQRKAVEEIRMAQAEIAEKSLFIKSNQERINRIMDTLLKYTVLDFRQHIAISDKGDELDAIAVGLNTLSEELENHIQQLESTGTQLESVNKELESFSYSVSHDLRAPLRAIDGYARIMEEDYGKTLDDEGKRLLGVIQYNAKRMGTLIDDLLAFSRLGKKELQRSTINMSELVEAALFDINKSTNSKAKIKIGTLHPLKGDYSLINQVMMNFISNAIKYSSKKENPVVEISSDIKDGQVIYSVMDNGVGFNMDYSHKLFGVFQRLHTMDEFEGTGVGLAIVKRVINKHGGRVWADSIPGKGATFYFSIPNC